MRRAAERSCCVEVYRPWSYQSLRSTAAFWLQTNAYGGDSVHGVAEAMARLHVCARHHASSLLRQQPVNPASYLHFLHHFCELFSRLQEKAQQEAHRLETVVSRLEEMTNTAQDILRTQRERIHALQQEQGSVLGAIADLELQLEESQNIIVREQTRLTELEKQLQETQQEVQAALEARIRKVSCLELSALEEVRGYRDPPEPVTMVMDAVCLLFHHPPGWDSAKHLLSLNSCASMIDYIVQCDRRLLDDAGFAEKAHAFHELWDEVSGELQQEEAALCDRSHSLSSCRPLFTLCAAVYKAVQQVVLLSPLYCYSLERLVRVLGAALSGGLLSHCAPPGAMEELSQRVLSWVLRDYEPCLFKSHAQVFKVLLCVALLQHRLLCSPAERQLFLRGLRTKDHLHSETWTETCHTISIETECVSESYAELPPWIPALTVPQLRCLEQLPVFRDLLSSLSHAPELWQEYMRVPSTVIGPVPFEPFTQLCLLQRALLWRLLRPECLQRVAEDMCACVLSEVPICGVPQDLSQLLLLHSGPIILSGAPHSGSEALGIITQLALHAQVSVRVLCCWEQASLITALRKAPDQALWLVLKNAYLLEPWDPLWPQIHHLIHRSKGRSEEPSHRMLQFWFIVPEKHILRIPICVRQSALAVALDSCWTLAEQVQRSMRQMNVFSHRGLRSCVLFHSVLIQRQTGPEHSYNWCGSDLQALVQAYRDIAPLCSDHGGALLYLAVSLVHGAHVLDTTHLEEIRSVAQAYLLSASQEWSFLDTAGQRDSCVPVPALEARSLGFGEHVIEERLQKKSHTLDVLLQASQGTCVGDMSNRTGAVPLLQRLRALEAHMRVCTEAPEPRPGPLQDFLQGEWETLRHVVSSRLSPMSPPPSEAELKHLERRVELLTSYLWQCESLQPQALSLSALSRPQGFLLSLRRHYSQAQGTQLSHTSLLFQVPA
uniref:Dynein heavy chain domain-containing protein 1 n=1 Tax=Knipowitschia caucasica TaxID=637954 RepID=A0AAV2LHX9_KNICA